MKKIFVLILFLLLIPAAFAKSGSLKLLAVSNVETSPIGSVASLDLEIKQGTGRVFIDSFPLSKLDTQISTRFAKEVACNFLEKDCNLYDFFYTIRANSQVIGGPSAGAAITVLTIAVLEDLDIDETATITGTINTGGIIGPVGSILPKTEAAGKNGLTKILIPKYTASNLTNVSDYEELYDVEIIEVSQLTEAVKEITGKDYSIDSELDISHSYIETMNKISKQMCDKAEKMSQEAYETEENNTAFILLKRGKDALETEEFYSAASYCFGSKINLRYKILQDDELSEKQIEKLIASTKKRADNFLNQTKNLEKQTLTDLEAYMAVTDRIIEANDRLIAAEFALENNNTNTSLYQLGYAIERLNSAQQWSVFFENKGKEFQISQEDLERSCLEKISEVEERLQYLSLYFSRSTADIQESLIRANEDYNKDNPELCLYKASIAKAQVDLVINNMAVGEDYVEEVIEDRLGLVRSLIAKQNSKGTFPILAYSYYEYANSLKEKDQYSTLLYLEYALELGNLDIYFEKQKISLPKLPTDFIIFYLSGLLSGFVAALILIRYLKKKTRKRL